MNRTLTPREEEALLQVVRKSVRFEQAARVGVGVLGVGIFGGALWMAACAFDPRVDTAYTLWMAALVAGCGGFAVLLAIRTRESQDPPALSGAGTRPVVREATPSEASYVERVLRSHRRAVGGLVGALALVGAVAAGFVATESLLLAAVVLAMAGGGAGTIWALSSHLFRARPTGEVVALSGSVTRHELDGGDPLRSHAVGGEGAYVPRGWAAMVGEDDAVEAEAVSADTAKPGGVPYGLERRLVVVSARRRSDGATFSVEDELAAGGDRYHRPLAGAVAPTSWAMGAVFAFSAVVFGFVYAGDDLDAAFAAVAATVAGALLLLSAVTGVPFLRSRSRVEAYRDRAGLMPAAERRRRRARESAAAAAFGAVSCGAAAPLVGAPVWLGAAFGVLFLVPFTWFRPLPGVKTRA